MQEKNLTPEQKQALTDFIFGKSDYNPLEKVRKEQPNRWKNKYGSADIKEHTYEESKLKLCPCCGKIKSINDFFKLNHSKDGKQQHCKLCQTSRLKETYRQNKDKK